MDSNPIIVALDYPDAQSAMSFVDQVDPGLCRLKVGKELFTAAGPAFVEQLVKRNYDVFLDLKFHDIPNTVAAACASAADLGVWLMNVHAMGGRRMMAAAKEALVKKDSAARLIAVTVLTSMDKTDLEEIGIQASPQEMVGRLAGLAHDAGMDGVVCSAREIELLRKQINDDFMLVTPGIRPAGSAKDDQRRTLTPEEAISLGASCLVIGRPITKSEDPVKTLQEIRASLGLS